MKTVLLFLLFASSAFVGLTQVKKPQAPPVKTPFTKSLQALIVTTKDWTAINGTARLVERKTRKSKWKAVGVEFPIVVGNKGLIWEEAAPVKEDLVDWFKREGDGKSPAGLFPLTFAFGSMEKIRGIRLPFTRLERHTECVDDPESSHYNKIVNRMQVGNFDWKSSEKMLEVGEQYELGVFVAHNSYPVRGIRGSCIFLHIWKDVNSPTNGCTAMERANLEKVTGWLDPKKNPYLVQMPEAEYFKYQKLWKLPKLK